MTASRSQGAAVSQSASAQAQSAPRAAVGRPGSKYGAVPTTVGGQRFASKREAARYQTLAMLERAGEIRGLALQVPFDLHAAGGKKVGRYVADFAYWAKLPDGWDHVVEDSKGFRTPMYRWKARHVAAEYGIKILET